MDLPLVAKACAIDCTFVLLYERYARSRLREFKGHGNTGQAGTENGYVRYRPRRAVGSHSPTLRTAHRSATAPRHRLLAFGPNCYLCGAAARGAASKRKSSKLVTTDHRKSSRAASRERHRPQRLRLSLDWYVGGAGLSGGQLPAQPDFGRGRCYRSQTSTEARPRSEE